MGMCVAARGRAKDGSGQRDKGRSAAKVNDWLCRPEVEVASFENRLSGT